MLRNHRIVVSAITYAERRFRCHRSEVLAAVDATTDIRVALRLAGTPNGPNDTAIAGHAIATGDVLVTNNGREFARVQVLVLEDWVQ